MQCYITFDYMPTTSATYTIASTTSSGKCTVACLRGNTEAFFAQNGTVNVTVTGGKIRATFSNVITKNMSNNATAKATADFTCN
jgi:hypothetical protein